MSLAAQSLFHDPTTSVISKRPHPALSPQMMGRPVDEATALVPIVVPLCALAQDIAIRLALGAKIPIDVKARLTRDAILDHLTRLFIYLPHVLELRATALPTRWEADPDRLRPQVFGRLGRLPADLGEFKRWLAAGEGVAPVIAAIGARFLPGETATAVIAGVSPCTAFQLLPLENSLAGRHAAHPLMVDIEAKHRRGPLWRAVARLVDLDSCLDGDFARFARPATGRACVHASRGVYAVEAAIHDGRVETFRRITPTDHLRAPGGVWDQIIDNLPAERLTEIALIKAILDPCKDLYI